MEQAEKYKRECVLHERCSLNISISVCHVGIPGDDKVENIEIISSTLLVWTFMEKAPQTVENRILNLIFTFHRF